MSGRQLFIIDKFRDTGRPLLSVLADPKSIFMSGLCRFQRHSLYTNIVNDRSAVYYTTAIEKTDPYKNIDSLNINFLDGFGDVILDPTDPFGPRRKVPDPASFSSVTRSSIMWLKRIPFMLALAIFVPVGVMTFLLNSVIQTVRSSSRIKLHENGKAGLDVHEYRVPLWITEMREEVEHAFEALNSSQNQEHLAIGDDDDEDGDEVEEHRMRMKRERRMSMPTQPTLALAPCQFEMIDALHSVRWRKYPVWIQKVRHSHAAMIVRMDRPAFSEGHVVLGHFVNEEFLI
jgi:hypothetical protein